MGPRNGSRSTESLHRGQVGLHADFVVFVALVSCRFCFAVPQGRPPFPDWPGEGGLFLVPSRLSFAARRACGGRLPKDLPDARPPFGTAASGLSPFLF